MKIGNCNLDLTKSETAFRILLFAPVNLNFQNSESGRPTAISHAPNLSLIYLYQWLKKQFKFEVDIQIIEQFAYNIGFDLIPQLLKIYSPRLVGITSSTFNIFGAYEIARLTKQVFPECTAVLGGAHATVLPEHTLKECSDIDVCVCGEGELTLAEIIQHLMANGRVSEMSHIMGLVYRSQDGEIIQTPPRQVIEDMDILPYPTYEEIDMSQIDYKFCPLTNKNDIYFSTFASRGCIFKCSFCTPLLTRKFRHRSPESILEEIRYLRHNFRAEVIYFEDSCMSINENWFQAVCDAFISSGLSREVRWGFETRVDLVNEQLLLNAVKAGCIFVNFGLESGSDLVLKKNRKNFTTKDIMRALEITRRSGVQIILGSFILGLPFETSELIQQTIDFIDEVDLDMIPINIVDLYPGTELFDMTDRGEGGMRWIPGNRMNWESYGRDIIMAEVNDLSEERLLEYYQIALDKVERKTQIRYSF